MDLKQRVFEHVAEFGLGGGIPSSLDTFTTQEWAVGMDAVKEAGLLGKAEQANRIYVQQLCRFIHGVGIYEFDFLDYSMRFLNSDKSYGSIFHTGILSTREFETINRNKIYAGKRMGCSWLSLSSFGRPRNIARLLYNIGINEGLQWSHYLARCFDTGLFNKYEAHEAVFHSPYFKGDAYFPGEIRRFLFLEFTKRVARGMPGGKR